MIPSNPDSKKLYLFFYKPVENQQELMDRVKELPRRMRVSEFYNTLKDIHFMTRENCKAIVVDNPYDDWSECNAYIYRESINECIINHVNFKEEQYILSEYKFIDVTYLMGDSEKKGFDFVIVLLKQIMYTEGVFPIRAMKLKTFDMSEMIQKQIEEGPHPIPNTFKIIMENDEDFKIRYHVVRKIEDKNE